MLLLIGAAAMGAIAGWWSTPLIGARHRLQSWVAMAGALAALALEAAWFGGDATVIPLLAGFAAGFIAHALFRGVLLAQFGSLGR